ncbi:MAG: hypothetical protein AAGC44_05160 [Planctomycetota bacterium]
MAKVLFKDGKMQFSDTGKILFTQAGDDPEDCVCCSDDPCTSCGSTDPEDGAASGLAGADNCTEYNTTYPFLSHGLNDGRCEWSWRVTGLSRGTGQFLLWYHPAGTGRSYACGTGSVVVADGEWLLFFERLEPGANTTAMKNTSGFACNPATGKVSGADTIDICDEHSCTGPITFTVPA